MHQHPGTVFYLVMFEIDVLLHALAALLHALHCGYLQLFLQQISTVHSGPVPFLSFFRQRCFAVQTNFSIIRHTRWFCLCLHVTNALSCYLTPQFLKQLPYFTVNWCALESIWNVTHCLLSSSVHRPVTAPNLPCKSLWYMTDLHHILLQHFDVSLLRPI
jgi:hypothetical protein